MNFNNLDNTVGRLSDSLQADYMGLQNGLSNIGYETLRNFGTTQSQIAQCCCETQKEIMQNRYDNALAMQNLQAQMAACCSETKTAIHAEGEATRALMQTNTIQELRDQLQAAQLQLGTLSQTNTIIGTLRPTPIPAYITCSPYQSEQYNCGAYGGCCGR